MKRKENCIVKKTFQEPELNVQAFSVEDVITTSLKEDQLPEDEF